MGESEEKARSQPLNPTLEMYVRCYFETDRGRLRLATLRLRREIGRAIRYWLWHCGVPAKIAFWGIYRKK